jgi:hypothetical protein
MRGEEKKTEENHKTLHYLIKKKENTKMKFICFYLSLGVPSLFSIGIVLKQPVGND